MAGNDADTLALYHFDGLDGATSGAGFADDSIGGSTHNLTAVGNAQIDTAQSVFGGSSMLFDGDGDYAYADDSVDFSLGLHDFGFDCRVRPASFAARNEITGHYNNSSNDRSWKLQIENSTTVRLAVSSTGADNEAVDWTGLSLSVNTWYHISLMRTGTSWDLFVDGVHAGTKTSTVSTLYNSSAKFLIGRGNYIGGIASDSFDGHIDEARLIVGVRPMDDSRDPLYISSGNPADGFTPPAIAYSVSQDVIKTIRSRIAFPINKVPSSALVW